MVQRMFAFVLAVGIATISSDDDDMPKAPEGSPPTFILAQASQKDKNAKVFVTFWFPRLETKNARKEIVKDGKPQQVDIVVSNPVWSAEERTVDGKSVEAFEVDGTPIKPAELPQRLARPTHAVVFRNSSRIDPFYLHVLRDDVIVFKFNRQ